VNVGVVHHLPPAGGAVRVLAEWAARSPHHDVTVYTRFPPAERELVSLPERVPVRRFPLPEPRGRIGRLRALRVLPDRGRELAGIVDAAGHDAVFAFPSDLTQSHDVLPHLRTPSLAYAPEPLRAAHEPMPRFGPGPTLRERLVRAGLDPYERLRRRLDLGHLPGADRVVTHSRYSASELRRVYGVEADVVPLGVDAEAFAGPEQERAGVLSVGALHPLKGHHFVIEALATLPAGTRPPLTIVGDRGALADPLRRLAESSGVALELLQAIPFDELVGRYRSAAVLACGMVREPFGLITLEGMAAGTPVVAVAEGGFTETVDDGRTGLLTPRDPEAFGAAVARVLGDRALAGRLAEAGRREARERWTWERTADGYDRLLTQVAGLS
jgi:glycosyltransferase involved in cell wall biosynthesis